jgi:hypothetical protein
VGGHLRRWVGVINKNEFVEVLDSSVSVVTRIQVGFGVRSRRGAVLSLSISLFLSLSLQRRDRLGPIKSRIYCIPGFSPRVSCGRTEVVNTWSYTATTVYTFDNLMN